MTKKLQSLLAVTLLLIGAAGGLVACDEAGKDANASAKDVRRIAIHVDESDKAKMNMALNNAKNVLSYYKGKGIAAEVRVVAYGPGLDMLRKDKSPVKERIAAMSLEQPGLTFAACGNTIKGVEKKTGTKVEILDEAKVVPSGVVELAELQKSGWVYIKP